MGRIDDMVAAGMVKEAHGRALNRKLDAAIKQIGKGNVGAAMDQLTAVVEQVEKLRDDGHVSPADADYIIAKVNEILGMLAP